MGEKVKGRRIGAWCGSDGSGRCCISQGMGGSVCQGWVAELVLRSVMAGVQQKTHP